MLEMWLAVPTNGVDSGVPCLVVAGVDGDVACVDQKWPCSQNGFEVVVTPLNGAMVMGPSIGDVAHPPLVQGGVRCKHRQAVVSTCLVGRVHLSVLGSQKIDSHLLIP